MLPLCHRGPQSGLKALGEAPLSFNYLQLPSEVRIRICDMVAKCPLPGAYYRGSNMLQFYFSEFGRVRNLKFATYLKFATCENTNKINELW